VVARQLLARGQKVRAVVRNAHKGAALATLGAELVQPELHDRRALTALLRGVSGAYVMLPPRVDSDDLLQAARTLCDDLAVAIAEAAVPHVVFLSSVGAHLASGTGPILSNRYGEEAFGKTSAALSALRPPYFMENWGESLAGLAEHKLHSMLALDHAIPMIATEDIGLAAAATLLEGPRGARVVELSGPRDYTPRDVARALSALLGREITPELVPNQVIPGLLTGFGMSPRNAELMREMHAGIDAGRIVHEGAVAPLRGQLGIESVLRTLLARSGREQAA
jgi:uncharacterized protein YbjT (DUF2867 family)